MKLDRKYIYWKYDGHCAYCGREIAIRDMQVDHILPKRNGGSDDLDNLNPACRRCNHYKRALTIDGPYGFRQRMLTIHERIAKNYLVRIGLDFGILTIAPFDGVFYFEKQRDNTPKQQSLL